MATVRRRTKVMASIDPADLELAKQLAADLNGKLGIGVTIGDSDSPRPVVRIRFAKATGLD